MAASPCRWSVVRLSLGVEDISGRLGMVRCGVGWMVLCHRHSQVVPSVSECDGGMVLSRMAAAVGGGPDGRGRDGHRTMRFIAPDRAIARYILYVQASGVMLWHRVFQQSVLRWLPREV